MHSDGNLSCSVECIVQKFSAYWGDIPVFFVCFFLIYSVLYMIGNVHHIEMKPLVNKQWHVCGTLYFLN